MRVKKVSVSKLIKELDKRFSLKTRLKYADKEGICTCYTCGHKAHYKKMQAGHYISRFYKKTRWDERNVRVQCVLCNLWKRGDSVPFRQKLVEEYGEKAVKEMELSRNETQKLEKEWLLEKLKEYDIINKWMN